MKNKKLTVESMLAGTGIAELNEMQQRAGESIGTQEKIILLSGTGTGKTLAYLLPLALQLDPTQKKTQALIIVPSRELALQTEKVFKQLQTGYKFTSCYGGHLRETEENNLLEAPALIVGTPGRLCDHLRRGNISTEAIQILVLDEFDKSAELGFQEEISFIVEQLRSLNKRILISATDSGTLPAFLQMDGAVKMDFQH
ncbi:MAG: DEAD/DEAH box helicase, partial [Bacteroidota bacterium]|nr:DEAD/DEAH box helicase [Bacteroidota bacterium]